MRCTPPPVFNVTPRRRAPRTRTEPDLDFTRPPITYGAVAVAVSMQPPKDKEVFTSRSVDLEMAQTYDSMHQLQSIAALLNWQQDKWLLKMSRHDDFRVGWPMCVFCAPKIVMGGGGGGRQSARFEKWSFWPISRLVLCFGAFTLFVPSRTIRGARRHFGFRIRSFVLCPSQSLMHPQVHKYPNGFLLTQ